MKSFVLACSMLFLVGCTNISQTDFKDHQSEYRELVEFLLSNNLASINQVIVKDLPESENITEIIEKLGVSRVSVNLEYNNHVLIIKKVIPPGYYQGYLYIVDTELPLKSDLYKSFEPITEHWAIVADD